MAKDNHSKSHDQRMTRGKISEEAGAQYLANQGYSIIQRNWRCRSGELDIIAEKHQTVVITEVRSRSQYGYRYGSALEAIPPHKIKQVRNTALIYLQHNNLLNRPIRFDVLAVTMHNNEVITIEHIKNAF